MGVDSFIMLSSRERALVAMAVLLDGREAVNVLAQDNSRGEILKKAVEELSAIAPDLRMPFIGSVLRMTLDEMRAG